MTRALFLALPALALLAACDTQDNATTQSETATVPDEDGVVAAPTDGTDSGGMDSGTPGSDAPTTPPGATAPGRPPDANTPEPGGPENRQGDNRIRAPGPTNPPPDGTTPPPA
jgi:hypothetical protein